MTIVGRLLLLLSICGCHSWMVTRSMPANVPSRLCVSSSAKSTVMTSSSHTTEQDTACSTSYKRIVKSSTANDTKGRVIMLHGWAQNANVLCMKTKTLTKKLNQAGYDCIFLQGPHLLPIKSTDDRDNARAWFLLNQTDPSDASLSQAGIPLTYHGLDASLDIVQTERGRSVHMDCSPNSSSSDTNGDNGYLTAVFGFSQGAVFCHILTVSAQRDPQRFGNIHAALIASGFAAQHVPNPTTTQQQAYDTGRLPDRQSIQIPSLHLIGKMDTSVNPALSLDLTFVFDEGQVMWHDKGHVVPQKSAECARIIAFLDACRSKQQQTSSLL